MQGVVTQSCVSQEFVDSFHCLNSVAPEPLRVTPQGGCDFLRDATSRNITSAHAVLISSGGQVLKCCEAADVYTPGNSGFELLFKAAVNVVDFSGVGLYMSEVVPNFKFMHIDLAKRTGGFLCWVRNRKAKPTDPHTYSYFRDSGLCWQRFLKILKPGETA